eukprot:TRINITY_DN75251_c0_g1_i1.p1 TRINITY_DN75251_c0_g1~~TRINITY_DN75251_c0_g1_i1.p1  ORF type:complete len:267 (+),score=49.01 TRINITY_DN75251_c0_g1_i1:106-906(+)
MTPRHERAAAAGKRRLTRQLQFWRHHGAVLLGCLTVLALSVHLPRLPATIVSMAQAQRILGVSPGATSEELKKAMRRKIREVHPDVIKDDGSKLREVREAFAALDPEQVPSGWSLDPTSWPGAAGVNVPKGRAGSWGSPEAQAKLRREEEERRKRNLASRGRWESLQEEQMNSQVFMPGAGRHPNRDVMTATLDWYKALTNIRIRQTADSSSPALGTVVRQGETVVVNGELVKNGIKYLKLRDQAGWIFNKGVSGDWKDRPIVQHL